MNLMFLNPYPNINDFYIDSLFEEIISSKRETCALEFLIGNGIQGQGRDACMDKCGTNSECKYYFFTDDNWCSLYTSCNTKRTPGTIGSTFKKIGT